MDAAKRSEYNALFAQVEARKARFEISSVRVKAIKGEIVFIFKEAAVHGRNVLASGNFASTGGKRCRGPGVTCSGSATSHKAHNFFCSRRKNRREADVRAFLRGNIDAIAKKRAAELEVRPCIMCV